MPLSSTFAAGRLVARARIGRKLENAFAFSQVTGLATFRPKIVRVFEFIPLSSAPGRIRTYAHGSGGRSCMTLPPGKMRRSRPVGERMGSARREPS